MNKKVSLGLTIALIFVSISATFAVTMTVSQNIYNSLISKLSSRFELYDGISAIDNYIRTNYYGDFDDGSLVAYSAQGYMRGLNDPGSFYMSAQEYIEYTRRMAGEGGIGAAFVYDKDKRQVTVSDVYSGSSAENAELKVGDLIIAVDGEKVTAENALAMIDSLQVGRRFESVSLTYERSGAQKTVTVMRGYTKTVTSSNLGNVGYVRIGGFYSNTAEQFSNEIASLNSLGVTALIIDLRSCGEGSVEYASAVADLLLPSGAETTGAIASAISKDGSVYKNFTSDMQAITFPGGIIVLTNGRTSGGAELLAAQLRDFSRCRVMGTATAGAMTMQQVFTLENGSAISLTVAKIKSYSGKFYCNGEGLVPDDVVEASATDKIAVSLKGVNEDTQLLSAYSTLVK